MGNVLPYEIGKLKDVCSKTLQALNISDKDANNFYRIDKPVIICLGGNRVARLKQIFSQCSFLESLIGLKEKSKDGQVGTFEDVDILGISYGINVDKVLASDGISKQKCDFTKEEMDEIIDNLLMPLFTTNGGEKMPLKRAKANFSMVTFFTYCNGALKLYDILNGLKDRLSKLGYSDYEIDNIMSDGRQVTYAPMTDARNIPTIAFKSLNDSTLKYEKTFMLEHHEVVNGIKVYFNDKLKQGNLIFPKGEQPCLEVVSSKMLNETNEIQNEHLLELLERFSHNWLLCDNRESRNLDAMSQMMACAVSRNVARSLGIYYHGEYVPNMTIKEEQNELMGVLDNFQEDELSLAD